MKPWTSLLLGGALAAFAMPDGAGAASIRVQNVVLVHGAFADGSGWRSVYERLIGKGYRVSIVQEPETSLDEDVAATRRVLDLQDGPTVLVGHSWGGQVITEAGVHPKVVALVYLAALMPDVGESTATLETMAQFPPPNDDVKATQDHFFYMDPARYQANFAADSSKPVADFMAASQVFLAEKAFKAPAKAAAWHSKPSWAVVPTDDKTINPDLQRWMYARAKAEVTEVPGSSHTVFLSHPDLVVALIEKAAGR